LILPCFDTVVRNRFCRILFPTNAAFYSTLYVCCRCRSPNPRNVFISALKMVTVKIRPFKLFNSLSFVIQWFEVKEKKFSTTPPNSFNCYRQVPATTLCCTETGFAEKPATLKQPEQIQKELQPIKRIVKSADPKTTSLKRQQNHKTVTRHKRNHVTTSHDQVKTRAPKIYLMVLEAFKISQSPDNYASNNQLDYLKKMGISKSHDDLWV